MKKKKSFWRAVGVSLLLLLLFYSAQIIGAVGSSIVGIFSAMLNDPNAMELISDIEEFQKSELMGTITLWSILIGEGLLIIGIMIFYLAKRKNPLKQLEINPVSPITIFLSIAVGFSLNLFVDFGLGLLPIPQNMLDEFNDTFEGIYKAPTFLIILGIGIIGPICEEVIFRGGIMNTFRRNVGAVFAIIASGIIFGLVHGIPVQILYAAFVGIILGIIFHTTKSLIPTIIIHIVNNVISDYTADLFGWAEKYPYITVAASGLITLVCMILMALIEKNKIYSVAHDYEDAPEITSV